MNRPKLEIEGGLAGLEHFTLRDYIRLLLRRRWLILVTTLTVALGTALMAFFLPNVYRATTVILVDPRKVPDSYVVSTVTSGVADRLATLRQQILSASRLGQIIEEMGLYAELKSKRTQEEIVEIMRKAIEVEVVTTMSGDQGLGAFNISYSSGHSGKAAQVTNRLASVFIDENIKAREQQVIGTAEFLERELEEAKKQLETKEERIRQIKTQYVSELPESQTLHLQALSSLQLELRGEMEAASRAQQQRIYWQSLLAESAPVINLDRAGPSSTELIPLQVQLVQAQTQLEDLRKRYGPNHPDFIKKNLEVMDLQRRVEQLKKADEPSRREVVATPQRRTNPVAESQIAALEEDIRKHAERQVEIRRKIAYHQSKLERIPVLEQQIASIMRDYEVARDHYRMLLDRKFSADMSTNLEMRQKGERFVVLDAAQPPERPTRPNRPFINSVGLVAGFAVGLVLAIVLELFDGTVKTEREVTELIEVPILGEIPWLPTVLEKRRQRLRTVSAALGSTLLATAYAALVVLTWN